jgi:hypothetical protein
LLGFVVHMLSHHMHPTKELKYTSKYYLVSHQQSEKVLLF